MFIAVNVEFRFGNLLPNFLPRDVCDRFQPFVGIAIVVKIAIARGAPIL